MLRRAVVSEDAWIAHNEQYLLDLYETIQEANATTGRSVFDRQACPFPQFCKLCFMNSSLYTRDLAYLYNKEDEDGHGSD